MYAKFTAIFNCDEILDSHLARGLRILWNEEPLPIRFPLNFLSFLTAPIYLDVIVCYLRTPGSQWRGALLSVFNGVQRIP